MKSQCATHTKADNEYFLKFASKLIITFFNGIYPVVIRFLITVLHRCPMSRQQFSHGCETVGRQEFAKAVHFEGAAGVTVDDITRQVTGAIIPERLR